MNNKKDILAAFIVLHYKNAKLTIQCVNSFLKLKRIDECRIVIYDNASHNGSYEELLQYYSGNNLVIVDKSDLEKSGFSRGNNDAYKKIKEKYSPKYVIAINNDTKIKQKNFINVLESIYETGKYHVIGPDVFIPRPRYVHQTPSKLSNHTLSEVKKISVDDNLWRLNHPEEFYDSVNRTNRLHTWMKWCPKFCIDFLRYIQYLFGRVSEENYKIRHYYKKEHLNAALYGACLIFTDYFIYENDYLYYPETPFYVEEEILGFMNEVRGYTSLYTPKLQVIHYESVSTKAIGINLDYLNFTYNSGSQSYQIFKNLLQEYPEYGKKYIDIEDDIK